MTGIPDGAYPESPSYHKKTPTTNTTCPFQITGLVDFNAMKIFA
jgi:hypothetical protein